MKGVKKDSVQALGKDLQGAGACKRDSKRTKHRHTNKKECQDCPFQQVAQQ